MKDGIHRTIDEDVIGHIMMDETEARMTDQMSDILRTAGDEIVHAHDVIAVGKETVAKMGTEKPGTAGDKDT